MNRRAWLGAAAFSILGAGCAQNKTMRSLNTALENSGSDARSFTTDYVEQLPYASIAVRLPTVKWALLVLGHAERDEMHWITADRAVLVTRFGRIVKTAGFNENLLATDFRGQDFLEPGASLIAGGRRRQVDMMPGNRYGVGIDSSLHSLGQETLLVGRRKLRLEVIEERCFSPVLNWRSVNRFWRDDEGFVWRSEQQATPGIVPFLVEVMKPYRT